MPIRYPKRKSGGRKNRSTSSAEESTSPSPVASNAPKFGTLIPNRIFVGGISPNTSEGELQSLFAMYGRVKAAKIILDRAGVSKGYGFVTFETEEEAKRIQKESEIILRDRKLNIAPAIKKQVNMVNDAPGYTFQNNRSISDDEEICFSYATEFLDQTVGDMKVDIPFARGFDSSPSNVPNGTLMYQNGISYTYHNGMAFFGAPENYCAYGNPQQTNYPVIYPSSVYVPQQPFLCASASAQYGSVSVPDLNQYMPATVTAPYYIPADQNY